MSAYDNLSSSQQEPIKAPLPYNKDTRTSVGAATSWQRPAGTGISSQSQGTFLKFGDETSASTIPKSDKGAGRNEA
jgi:hypothetical protein